MRVAAVLSVFAALFASSTAQKSTTQTPCGRLSLPNGIVRVKFRGAQVNLKCNPFYHLLGPKVILCVNRKFLPTLTEPPMCIRPGCRYPDPIENGYMKSELSGSKLLIFCNEGFETHEFPILVCNGLRWNSTVPQCYPKNPSLLCDLNSDELCGWEQGVEEPDDWTLQSQANPFRKDGTGPAGDDSESGKGKYLYLDNSVSSSLARIYSPVYAPSTENCLSFSYHMFGSDKLGAIRVYVVNASKEVLNSTIADGAEQGDQGDAWRKFYHSFTTEKSFQWVIEAEIPSGDVSVIAIDNLQLENSPCPNAPFKNSTSIPSCKFRCVTGSETNLGSDDCSCALMCEITGNCCSDFKKYCQIETPTTEMDNEVVPTSTLKTTLSTTPRATLKTVATSPSTVVTTQKTRATTSTTTRPTTTSTPSTTRITTSTTAKKTTLTARTNPPRLKTTPGLVTTLKALTTTVKVTSQTTSLSSTTLKVVQITVPQESPGGYDYQTGPSSGSMLVTLLACIVGVSVVLVVVGLIASLMRRRMLRTGGNSADQEVVFLTQDADEPHLDFNLATPDNVKTFTDHQRL
ncbi:uncharacterized protein LOC132193023 [Neocloeon triangulifer]|uniref:uncharacterized protein LOC132193023 n=1 Tax=Neocloeon triangulifer TaxID=2078957 RepID=UPI00286F3476|nr:uncharacterized protein LOC132193023 [Neocloeon triangulifer]